MNRGYDHIPPEWVLSFLRSFCPPSLYEGIEGDLVERFAEDVKHVGARRARMRIVLNALRFFRPDIILRNKFRFDLTQWFMLNSYFKVAARNIQKKKLYSFINAFGLSIGIAFCILIYLFISDELGFDRLHVNKERIYRIEEKSYDTWQQDAANPYNRSAYLQTALGPTVKAELPEVEYFTRYSSTNSVFRYEDKVFTETINYVDAGFFKMFSFPLRKGNADKIFNNKSDLVLTPEIAEKYFGEEDPIGKSVSIDIEGEKIFTVVGIIDAPPANSSISYRILAPQENRPYYDHNMNQWGNFNTPTFVQLQPNADLKTFKRNLDKVRDKYVGERLKEWRARATVKIPEDVQMLEFEFTPLVDWHLKKEISWEKVSDPKYSMILGGISILILIIACINYISLSLTTSASRKTEVGIRKVVGAQRQQLMYQFTIESFVLTFISMVIGIGLVILFLPAFNSFTSKGIEISLNMMPSIIGISVVLLLVVGLLAGSYPSFFLARFKPVVVLKGKFTSKLQAGFTKPLVVLQFALSAFLIISSVVMFRQMRFITTKDLGYNEEQVLVIPTHTGWNIEANRVVERFRARASGESQIVSVAGTSSSFNQGYSRYGYTINGEQKAAFVYAVDPEYIPILGIELVEGKNFDENIAADTAAVIVNESLVRDMKWKEPLSEYLNWQEDTLSRGSKVIGVVKDYHFLSLERKFEPMFLSMDKRNVGYLSTLLVKVTPNDIPAAIEKVREIWKEVNPNKPFDYTFLDEDVQKQYASYERWMSIMGLATAFAIVISCLGLFGLAGVNALNRTKEIGIRKVMGAGLSNIFMLLNRQFVAFALVAFVIAAPISWYVMNKWLSSFEFKIPIGWELFAVSGLAGITVALIAVSYHAIKAALINPAETLKYE